MASIKKIKKTAFVLFAVVGLILLWFIIGSIRMIVFTPMEWSAASLTMSIISVLIVLAILTVALVLLFSIKKDETPFNTKNVRWMKLIALLLVLIEPYMSVCQWISNKFFPVVLNDNTFVTVHTSYGGFILVAGLTVYCISLVFEYGISLQQQIDETL